MDRDWARRVPRSVGGILPEEDHAVNGTMKTGDGNEACDVCECTIPEATKYWESETHVRVCHFCVDILHKEMNA